MVLVLMIGILSESAQGVYAQTTAGGQAVAQGRAVAQGQAVTAEQAVADNQAVAGKQQDVDVSTLPESLTTFLYSLTWYYDNNGGNTYNSASAADGSSNMVAQIVKNGSCFFTNLYPVETYEAHWGETTPQLLAIDPYATSYMVWPAATVEWAAKNIYNVSDADYETLVAQCLSEKYFYRDTVNGKDSFIVSMGGIGDNFMQPSIVWATVDGTRYEVSYDVYRTLGSVEFAYSCFAVLELKTIDGAEYWSLVSLEEGIGPKTYMGTDAPELFTEIADTYMHTSGAGAWYEAITIHEDGTFDGYYYDHDYAVDKPYDSEIYWSLFSGAFKNPRQIDAYTYEFTIDYLFYYRMDGDELLIDYSGSTSHYTFCEVAMPEGTSVRFVKQGAPRARINEGYASWLPYWQESDGMHTQVDGFYGINDERGFYRSGGDPIAPEGILEGLGLSYEESIAIREIEVDFTDKIKLDLRWGWKLFEKDSSEYNHDLAMVGLTLSQAAETSKEACEARLQTLGFHDVKSVFYDRREQDMMFPAVTFAYQPITFQGQTKHVFVMVVRGTTDKGDIYTDLYSCFDGFVGARDNVKAEFRSFFESTVSKYNLDLNDDNTILFLTGHSLGGAMAGSMAYLMDAYGAQSKTFVYTYCSPLYETFGASPESFPNVHNILNKHDKIPTVPPLKKHFGHEWWYSKDVSTFEKGIFADHLCETILECMVEGLPSNMGPGAENHYRHSMIHCPVDIEVFDAATGEKLGYTLGSEVYLNSDKIYIYTNGDEKNVIAFEEDAFTIRIVGTGEGTMTYTDQLITGDGQLLSETVFENVAIEEGKIFEAGFGEAAESKTDSSSSSTESQPVLTLQVVDEEGKVIAQVAEDGTETKANRLSNLFSRNHQSSGTSLVLLIVLAGGLLLAVILLVVIILLYKRSRRNH